MIDDVSNCPYSYHRCFPGKWLYPDEVNAYVSSKDNIAELDEFTAAVLFQLILLAVGRTN